MSLTDPIADMLTRIRNALLVSSEAVSIPYSKLKEGIARILKQEGYIDEYKIEGELAKEKVINITLKYGPEKQKVITGLKRISKPGLRVYVSNDKLPRVLNGLGTAIISTSSGLMTDKDARKAKLGGEVICYIW